MVYAAPTMDPQAKLKGLLATSWKSANADGVLSEVEKKRLQSIAEELKLTQQELPTGWAALVIPS